MNRPSGENLASRLVGRTGEEWPRLAIRVDPDVRIAAIRVLAEQKRSAIRRPVLESQRPSATHQQLRGASSIRTLPKNRGVAGRRPVGDESAVPAPDRLKAVALGDEQALCTALQIANPHLHLRSFDKITRDLPAIRREGNGFKRHSPAGHGSGVPVAVQPEELRLLDMIGGYVDNRAVIGHRHVRVSMVLIDAVQDRSGITNGLESLVHRHGPERVTVREHEMARPGVARRDVAAAAKQSSSLSRLTRQHLEPGSVDARACDQKVMATR